MSRMRILSIDPGRDKCGIAVVDTRDGVLARGVVPTSATAAQAARWITAFRPSRIVVGNGTTVRSLRGSLRDLGLPLDVVPEAHTTERARKRYFEENPPRGWRRWFRTLLTPPVPVDDLAAVLIAEDFLAGRAVAEAEAPRAMQARA